MRQTSVGCLRQCCRRHTEAKVEEVVMVFAAVLVGEMEVLLRGSSMKERWCVDG